MNLASRLAAIEPFHVMELMARAEAREAKGQDIVHMEVGEPDFPTAEPILAAAQRFLQGGHVHYTAALGISRLREAIATWYATRHGLTVAPARVVVTAGASAALLLILGALTSPGDEWLLPDPGYPCYRHLVRFCEGRVQTIPVTAATAFQPTVEQVAEAWNTRSKGVLLASPANPTGTLIDAQALAAIHGFVARYGGHLVVDEIYHGLTYGCEAKTALSLADDIIVINSFSKYFGMTGWRLGWMVIPESLIRPIEKLAQNLFICPSTLAQHAALAAFLPETLAILESRRQIFAARRDVLLNGLSRLGFLVPVEPRGAFYIYADISRHADDAMTLAHQLIEEAGVAAVPGTDFGQQAAHRHMRFAYTVSEESLAEGLRRIERFLAQKRYSPADGGMPSASQKRQEMVKRDASPSETAMPLQD